MSADIASLPRFRLIDGHLLVNLANDQVVVTSDLTRAELDYLRGAAYARLLELRARDDRLVKLIETERERQMLAVLQGPAKPHPSEGLA